MSITTDSGSIVAGAFTDAHAAERAFDELRTGGYPQTRISENAAAAARETERSEKEFVAQLARGGIAERDAKHFVDVVARGGALITIDTRSDREAAIAKLRAHGAGFGSHSSAAASDDHADVREDKIRTRQPLRRMRATAGGSTEDVRASK